jgi:hypothetical protein
MKNWLSVESHSELCVMFEVNMIVTNASISARWVAWKRSAWRTMATMNHRISTSPGKPCSK